MQEIVRDVPKEYQNIIKELVNTKEYKKIPKAIEGIKYEVGGEYNFMKEIAKIKNFSEI